MPDKDLEIHRYDTRAKQKLRNYKEIYDEIIGPNAYPVFLRAPYNGYEAAIKSVLNSNTLVLELGAGTGEFTNVLLEGNATVVATDISPVAIELLSLRYANSSDKLTVQVCDIESLPFANDLFDLVVSAGVLSYGDNILVMSEIFRVLKPNGYFICVDSLNHNPIYKLNRYIHFLRGSRTFSTLKCMPTLGMIEMYRELFGFTKVSYFGAFSWLADLLAPFISPVRLALYSDVIDRIPIARCLAFKFVLVAKKLFKK